MIWFVGRRSEVVNVAGSKVHPPVVEQVIRAVAGVREVRVSGLKSSLAGELVAAHVEPEQGIDRTDLRRAIVSTCREQLARHALPSVIEFHDRLAVTASGKLARDGSNP